MSEMNNSLCAYYAVIIENQLAAEETDMAVVSKMLDNIKTYCTVTANPPGEVPEQLEEHLFESGSTEEGTVVVGGKPMPSSAAEHLKEGAGDDL